MEVAFASPVPPHTLRFFEKAHNIRISSIKRHTLSTIRTHRCFINASAQKPPAVKSSFYKNPSKAIEKGGGFYIPGLRGPRLRVFVATVALSLLSINHVASLQVRTVSALSFTVSEIVAIFAATCVGASAFLDIKSEEDGSVPISNVEASVEKTVTSTAAEQTVYKIDDSFEDVMAWTARVAMQMTGLDGFCVFQDDYLVFARGDVTDAKERGLAVERVASEDKALYIDDTRQLPLKVRFPFLQSCDVGYRVYIVPIVNGRAVVVFSGKLSSDVQLISLRDRTWLKECASRIEECYL